MILPSPAAPVPERRPRVRRHHGDVFNDPYEWLRDRDDPRVLAHLEAENAFTEHRTAHLAALRGTIFEEIRSRVRETDVSVPARRGTWWYFTRTRAGAEYATYCRVPAVGADWTPPEIGDEAAPGEELLLDGNAEARGHDFFALGSFEVSADGGLLLWASDVTGDERYTLRVRDLTTGRTLEDIIPDTFAGATFTPDGTGVVYLTVDEAWRPDTVRLHLLGTDPADDPVLFHEPDERYWVSAGFTRSDRYLVIAVASSVTTEERLLEATDLGGEARVVWPRAEGVEYDSSHAVVNGRDVLYILHNQAAMDFELVRVDADDPGGPRTVVLPHREGTRLLGVSTFRDWAVVDYRADGLGRIGILDYGSGQVREVGFGDDLYSAGTAGTGEWAPPTLRLGFESFITPATVYDYEPITGVLHERKRQWAGAGYDPAAYGQRREWATAPDGTRVPVSLVWKRSFGEPGEGARPLHLYGYGSYEHAIEPGFSVARLSELDRGVVFAIAHVRGGGELGRRWYEDGKMLRKRNTFTDFVACARLLIDRGYTSADRMVAEGGSAGGLLVGAVANLAPELFAGVLADVPFVDALHTILDPSLPLTVIEWDEWGDPLHDADVYAYMKSYTPYENVRDDVRYPRVLAITSFNDTRVLYVEPAKWVARLRDAGADALLRCEMAAGHGGASGRYRSWRERAFELAWMLDVMGAPTT